MSSFLLRPFKHRNGTAVLNEDDVKEIRRCLQYEYRGIGRMLAKRFGVSPITISRIKRRKSWKHVT